MKRIMVMGVSAGVGKSTFARRLGEIVDIDVYHLDALYWKPEWVEASLEEFAAGQQEIVTIDQWIIEGNYSNTYNIRAQHADTIIYLELPLLDCLYRVFKRWLLNIGRVRPDMGKGCNEKLDTTNLSNSFAPPITLAKKRCKLDFKLFKELVLKKTLLR